MILKVIFETVSAVSHPQFYTHNGKPKFEANTIPNEYWHSVVNYKSSRLQYDYLLKMQQDGDYIREVRLFEAEEVVWKEITPNDR